MLFRNRYTSLVQAVKKKEHMGIKVKVQLIKRDQSDQFYVNIPFAVAQAMKIKKGEEVEWSVKSRNALILQRVREPKKK